jgi:hypothetical protein
MNLHPQTETAMGTRARRQWSSDRARSADDGLWLATVIPAVRIGRAIRIHPDVAQRGSKTSPVSG